VNVHGASHVDGTQFSSADRLIQAVDNNFYSRDTPKLDEGALAEECAESDQHSACTEVTNDERGDVEGNLHPVRLLFCRLEGLMPEANTEDRELEGVSGYHEVVADRSPAVRL